jgi:hypothetical protein
VKRSRFHPPCSPSDPVIRRERLTATRWPRLTT